MNTILKNNMMNKKKFLLVIVIFFVAALGTQAQSKTDSICVNEKGDLYQLTQRLYTAFSIFETGSPTQYGRSIQRPIILIYGMGMKENEFTVLPDEKLKLLKFDDVISIVAVRTPENAVYGVHGDPCIIKITLK
jgi:hypothetical protein